MLEAAESEIQRLRERITELEGSKASKWTPHGSTEVCLLCKCSLTGDKTCHFDCACHDKPTVPERSK